MIYYNISSTIARYLLWSDVGAYPKIVKMNLDGSDTTTLVSNGIKAPVTIFADISANKVYWADATTGGIYSIE